MHSRWTDERGPVNVVATRFAQELAVDGAHRATRAVSGVTVAFCILFALSTQVPAVRAASPFASGPYAAIAWLAVQIAFVCGIKLGALLASSRRQRAVGRDAAVDLARRRDRPRHRRRERLPGPNSRTAPIDPVGAPSLRAELVVGVGAVAVLAAFATVLRGSGAQTPVRSRPGGRRGFPAEQ